MSPSDRPTDRPPWDCLPEIESALDRFLPDLLNNYNPSLVDAIHYALEGPGKRVRPVLCWHACQACGVNGRAALPPAVAIELIHTFSLVHDDLPAMDNDDLRRGRPTLHKHTSETMAILAGDAMVPLAFSVLANARGYQPESAKQMIRELADATGKMVSGQVSDTLGGDLTDRLAAPIDRVRHIHEYKTGALIQAACRMGVIAAHAPVAPEAHGAPKLPLETSLKFITAYASELGMMFQITDDLLDIEGTTEQTGKRTRKDADAGKLTYPGVVGIEQAREDVRQHAWAARASLDEFGDQAMGLRAMVDFVESRVS